MNRPCLPLVLATGFVLLNLGEVRAGGPIEFNRDIRPILSENCNACHGPDKAHRKGGLRLDDRAVAVEKRAIVPGDVEESEIVARILSDDPDEVMPPPESNKVLTTVQKALIRQWVLEGARYQAHWAYEPIRRPALPTVQTQGWVKNPVDAFILSTLESKQLKPSVEADRRTLLRRLSLDLIGLPPSPQEVSAFVDDASAEAYERQVDRLLASLHYGERMAVPWLDLVRFADTVGYHGDQNQDVFPYRDYVINAFNRNLPFDQFTREQLAGDLLPGATTDQLVASGFNRLNMMTREGGAQPREYLAKYASDRVRTVATTWLGSTLGCAECHDHKYDPFKARDFYQLAAFFADVQQWGVYADYGYTPNPDLKGFTNDHPFPPEIEVVSPYLERRIARIDDQMRRVFATSAVRAPGPDFEDWQRATLDDLDQDPSGWKTPPLSIVTEPGVVSHAVQQPDGSVFLERSTSAKDVLKVRLEPESGWVAAIRVELLPHADHGGRTVRGVNPSATIQLSATYKSQPVEFWSADAPTRDERYANGQTILGVKDTWKTSSKNAVAPQTAVWLLDRPVRLDAGHAIELTIKGDNAGCLRFSTSPIGFPDARHPDVDPALAVALATATEKRSVDQQSSIRDAFLLGTGWDAASRLELRKLALARLQCRDGKTMSVITKGRIPVPVRVLARGNWQDETGEVVQAAVPHFLPQIPWNDWRSPDRLDLAQWLTSRDNPLTARVFVNRVWKQFFGNGLSAVMEDVGSQGEWPSHPELLDWLASDFRDGWNVKSLVKQVVMSATYRQDARLRPDLREADPNNRWLTSQNPRRLEAEFVRDNALSIAGLLDTDVGGPSAFPYQPPGYYANIQFPNRDYLASLDDRQYRRGVYTHWQRTFLHPMLANFDAPSREECTASRNQANTPQQALTLLNDLTFVEAARVLALASGEGSDGERLDQIFVKVLARPTRLVEKRSLLAFLDRQRVEASQHPQEARKLVKVGLTANPPGTDEVELAAWVEVCRVVLNLHETITRY